jgi:hypothetical protein
VPVFKTGAINQTPPPLRAARRYSSRGGYTPPRPGRILVADVVEYSP